MLFKMDAFFLKPRIFNSEVGRGLNPRSYRPIVFDANNFCIPRSLINHHLTPASAADTLASEN